MSMNLKVEHITPEMAREWLKRNVSNRNVSASRVSAYAKDMKANNWELNGEPIIFNENGELKDGQHRLMAIIKSGETVDMAVIYGVNNGVALYDRGRKRSASDALKIMGIYSNRLTVSIARTYFLLNGVWDSVISESMIKDFHIKHKETLLVIKRIANGVNKGTVNVRTAIFLTALAFAYEDGVDEKTLARFAKVVATGFYDSASEMAGIVLRNDILKGTVRNRTMVEKKESCCMVMNAIKDFADGYERKRTYKNSTEQIYKGKEQV